MTVAVKEREDQTTMKVSELLKKVGYIKGAAIRIEFNADKTDAEPDVEHLDADTTEETADLVIKRAEEYTLQEADLVDNVLMITAIRKIKRTSKPKPENPVKEAADRLKKESKESAQEIRDELERLDQAVADLIRTIIAPFHKIGQRAEKRRAGILAALHSARAAVRRILTRIFRKGTTRK